MKWLILILDGIPDRPVNGATPLSCASTPHLDGIVSRAEVGILDPIAPGIRPGSAPAHLALLGYDPFRDFTGRGPFEALGVGIKMDAGEIGFRCNFATIKNGIIIDRRAGRIRNPEPLEKAINEQVDIGVSFSFKLGAGHRAALVLHDPELSDQLTGNDPGRTGIPPLDPHPRSDDPAAIRTCKILREFISQSQNILENHPLNLERSSKGLPPANILLVRSPGKLPKLEPISAKYNIRAAVISGVALVAGVGIGCGMEYIRVPGATGGLDTDLSGKLLAGIKALDNHELVLINFKGPDEAGHDGDFRGKLEYLERLDPLLKTIEEMEEIGIVVTSDHTTPVKVRDHTGDPVPIAISSPEVRKDSVSHLDEFRAPSGALCRIRGRDVMPILANLAGWSEKYGE